MNINMLEYLAAIEQYGSLSFVLGETLALAPLVITSITCEPIVTLSPVTVVLGVSAAVCPSP